MASTLSYNETIISICEFLEVAIHSILYLRRVYPEELFVRRKKYDAPIYQSRHFGLNEYIAGSVKAIGQELTKGCVKAVVVVIKDRSDIALERFVFSVQTVLNVGTNDRDTPIPDAVSKTQLNQYFRSFLVKLSAAESQMADISVEQDQPTFAVVLEMKATATPSTSQSDDPLPWMPAVLQHTTAGVSDEEEIQMVRAMETGVINFSLLIQESQEKLQREEKRKGKGKQRAT